MKYLPTADPKTCLRSWFYCCVFSIALITGALTQVSGQTQVLEGGLNCYEKYVHKGRIEFNDKNFDRADKFFVAARKCNDCNTSERIHLVDSLHREAQKNEVAQLERLLAQSERDRLKAKKALVEAEIQKAEAERAKQKALTAERISHNMNSAFFVRNKNPQLALKIAHYNWKAHPGNQEAAHFFAQLTHDTSYNAYPPVLEIPDKKVSQGQEGDVIFVAFTHDGFRLLTCGRDNTIRLWNTRTGGEMARFRSTKGQVLSADISPNDSFIVSTNRDTTADVWSVHSGKQLFALGEGRPDAKHKDQVISVAFSPDGQFILTGSKDRTAKLWDARSGRPLMTYNGHTSSVWSVSFSPDGNLVLTTGSDDGTFRIWNRQSGKLIKKEFISRKGKTEELWSGDEIWYARFSPDGKKILTASGDKLLRLWGWEEQDTVIYLLASLQGHTEDIECAVFSPDGNYILSGSWDGTARLWDVRKGRIEQVFSEHKDIVRSVAFSPDGKYIATASLDGKARIWRVEGNLLEQEFSAFSSVQTKLTHTMEAGSGHRIRTVGASPDGKYYLTAGFDNRAVLWDALTGKELRSLRGHDDAVLAATFSNDGRKIFTGSRDSTIRIWETATGRVLGAVAQTTDVVIGLAASPDGRYVASGGKDGRIRIWDVKNAALLHVLIGHKDAIWAIDFSPDGQRLVSVGSRDSTAIIWDVAKAEKLLTLKGHNGPVWGARYSTDGTRIITSSRDHTAIIWDANTGREILKLVGHIKDVEAACFSPDGQFALTASWDGTAVIWNANSGIMLKSFTEHEEEVYSAAFSADGQNIITGGPDGKARTWDISAFYSFKDQLGHTEGGIRSIHVSGDGKNFITGGQDNKAVLWDLALGKPIAFFRAHSNEVTAARLSPDGTRAITTSRDSTAIIWNTKPDSTGAGQLISRLTAHSGEVKGASFSPDGKLVATCGDDGLVCLWDVSSGNLVRKFNGHQTDGNWVNCVVFSPDGLLILSGGRLDWILWEASSGRELMHEAALSGVYSATFTSNGNKLLLGVGGATVIEEWDLSKREKTRSVKTSEEITDRWDGIMALQYSPDGRLVMMGRSSGKMRVYESHTFDVLQEYDLPEVSKLYDATFTPDGQHILVANGTTSVPMLREVFAKYNIATEYSYGELAQAGVRFRPEDLIGVDDPVILLASAKDYEGVNDSLAFKLFEHALSLHRTADLLTGYYEVGQRIGNDQLPLIIEQTRIPMLDSIAVHFAGKKAWEKERLVRERICTLTDDWFKLWKLYESTENAGKTFDLYRFIALKDVNHLTSAAEELTKRRELKKAYRLFEEAERRQHNPKWVKRMYEISKETGLAFNRSLIFGSNDADELYEYATFFRTNLKDPESAYQLLERAEGIRHNFDQLLELYNLSELLGRKFDMERFLASNDQFELREYNEFFIEKGRRIRGDFRYVDAQFYYQNGIKMGEKLLTIQSTSDFRIKLSRDYVYSSWAYVMSKKFAEAEKDIRRGMELDPTNPYHKVNLPHTLVFQGKYEEAERRYLDVADGRFYSDSRDQTFRSIFLEDFKDFEENGIIPPKFRPDYELIKSKLFNGK